MLHGYLRDITSGCCTALKEKVFVEEENLQDERRDQKKTKKNTRVLKRIAQ